MKSLFFAAVLFGGVVFTSNQTRVEGLAINLAPTARQAAPHAAPFLFYAAATGALLACGTAAAIAGIVREEV